MSIRTERLSAVIQRDLGKIIQRSYQPSGTFVTVTRVRMTEDLSIAKVYLSVLAPNRDEKTVYQFIDEHIPEIRKELASLIRNQVRKIPELHFYPDDTAEYVDKMEQLFKKVEKQRKQEDSNEEE